MACRRFCGVVRRVTGPDCCQSGKQALRREHRQAIVTASPHYIMGSVNLDECLKPRLPNAPRWDYLIGCGEGQDCELICIDVHPARTRKHVDEFARKFEWLNAWFKGPGKEILGWATRPPRYHWLPTGSVASSRKSRRGIHASGARAPREWVRRQQQKGFRMTFGRPVILPCP